MTSRLSRSIEGEFVLELDSGAMIGLRLPDWAYEEVQAAAEKSSFETIELVRKALHHYLEHWVAVPTPANAMDAGLDMDREMYRDLDAWIVDVLKDDLTEQPSATIGIHLDGDQVDALFSVLELDSGESSVDFVRAAVLDRIAERQNDREQVDEPPANTEAAS